MPSGLWQTSRLQVCSFNLFYLLFPQELLQRHVGEFGPHQYVVTFQKCLQNFVGAMFTLAPVFIAATPRHWCDVTSHMTVTKQLSNCTQSQLEDMLLPHEHRHGLVVPSQCEVYNLTSDILWQIGSLNNTDSQHSCPLLDFTEHNSTVTCDKWVYDKTYYSETMVTEVHFFQYLLCSSSSSCRLQL